MSATPVNPAYEPATIVVIDDDPHVVAFASLVLEDEGYRVAAWHTGAGARGFIAREMPVAVLLDMEMETRDAGQQVLEEIGEDVSIRTIPIILASSRTQYLGEGIGKPRRLRDHALAKPYTAEALIAAVERAVAVRQRHGANES